MTVFPASLPRRFIVSHGVYSVAMGMHLVLLAWLAASYLELDAIQLAWVQAASLLPSILILLLSGVLADRLPLKSILSCSFLGMAVAYGFLAVLLYSNTLSFGALLLYGSAVGLFNGMTQPAREKWLAESVGSSTQRRISAASIAQFLSQGLGMLVAGAASSVNIVLVVLLPLLFTVVAAIGLNRAGQPAQVRNQPYASVGQDFMGGLRYMASDSALRQIIALAGFNGFMHMGLFLVVIPLMATTIYAMTAMQFALLQSSFVMGMIVAFVQIYKKQVVGHPGQSAVFCLLYSAGVVYALAQVPTVTGFFMVVIFWGWVAGQSACHSRLVLQALASSSFKGRLSSLYQFSFFGLAPLGALAAGYGIELFSLYQVFSFVSMSSVVIFVAFMFSRSLWSIAQEQDRH